MPPTAVTRSAARLCCIARMIGIPPGHGNSVTQQGFDAHNKARRGTRRPTCDCSFKAKAGAPVFWESRNGFWQMGREESFVGRHDVFPAPRRLEDDLGKERSSCRVIGPATCLSFTRSAHLVRRIKSTHDLNNHVDRVIVKYEVVVICHYGRRRNLEVARTFNVFDDKLQGDQAD